jgi:hypothetical protein
MAKFRRTAGWADWRETDPNVPCPICPHERPHRNRILHVAPLENGHELHAWSYDDSRWPEMGSNGGPSDYGWSWAIVNPSKYPDEPDKYNDHQDPEHFLAGDGGDSGDFDDPNHNDFIPTLEQAKKQAEQHYQRIFPLGTDTGKHDSGVDYDDIMRNYRDHL